MSEIDQEPFPRGALIGAAALISCALAATALARLTAYEQDRPSAPAELSRSLVFADREDGAVIVFDSEDLSEPIAVLASGEGGFVRGLMRGMARERRSMDVGAEPPFILARHYDGRLTLTDRATGRLIELDAFGETNTESFAVLLNPLGGET